MLPDIEFFLSAVTATSSRANANRRPSGFFAFGPALTAPKPAVSCTARGWRPVKTVSLEAHPKAIAAIPTRKTTAA